jgi:hypothetical protein
VSADLVRPPPATPRRLVLVGLLTIGALTGCKADDPPATPDGAPRPDAALIDSGPDAVPVDADPGCQPLDTDYQPRVDGSAGDTWPACISDDNAYHPFDASISTLARVAAFEEIRALLVTGAAPSPDDFLDARAQYLLANGLESRVARREDEHFPPVLDGGGSPVACQSLAPEDQQANADRCVGPARIGPLINAAFAVGQDAGSTDAARRIAAAQVEAGLLWFLYVSTHKEAMTCAQTQADCDSHYAYYTGGEPRELGKGLARYVRDLDGEAHDRVWDGVLAVRCWRDLDNPTGVAMDLALRDTAVGQLDRALLRGLALIVRDRTLDVAGTPPGAAQDAHWAFVRVLGPVLLREAEARDAGEAALLAAELATPAAIDVDAAQLLASLAALFPCA